MTRRITLRPWLLLLGALLTACGVPSADYSHPKASGSSATHVIHVVQRGWHAGLALDPDAIRATGLMPEAASFGTTPFVEIGWGDRAFYMAADPSAWLAARAALAPTPAVLHVLPLDDPPRGDAVDVIAIGLPDDGFVALVQAMADSVDRRATDGAAAPPEVGAWGGRFYAAQGRFHLFNTCNTWAARMLSAAGVDIDPTGVVTADTLMRRLRTASFAMH